MADPERKTVAAAGDELAIKKKKKKRKLAAIEEPATEQEPAPKKAKQVEAPLAKEPQQDQAHRKKNKKKRQTSGQATASNEALTVIIGGLPYDTTDATLSKDLSACGKIQKCNVPKDKETGRARGFAFLTFTTKEGADAALKFGGQMYNGRKLTARMAGDKPNSKPPGKPEAAGKTDDPLSVFVGGLPHNVTEKSLRRYFFSVGDIKALKLPLNEAGETKGFAFITFKDEAQVAKALENNEGWYGEGCIVVRKASDGGDKSGKGQGKDSQGKAKGKGKSTEFTVFVQGLTYWTTEEQLREMFGKCGEIVHFNLPMCQWDNTQSRGFAFISYKDQRSVDKALKLDGDQSISYDDCYMSVKKAVDREEAARQREQRQSESGGDASQRGKGKSKNDKQGGKANGKSKNDQKGEKGKGKAKSDQREKKETQWEAPQQQEDPLEALVDDRPVKLRGVLVESTGKKVEFDSSDDDDE